MSKIIYLICADDYEDTSVIFACRNKTKAERFAKAYEEKMLKHKEERVNLWKRGDEIRNKLMKELGITNEICLSDEYKEKERTELGKIGYYDLKRPSNKFYIDGMNSVYVKKIHLL